MISRLLSGIENIQNQIEKLKQQDKINEEQTKQGVVNRMVSKIVSSIESIQGQMGKLKQQDKINEEQTKQSLILPMFMALGYNIFDPTEFIPEFIADIGTKAGEKVDYAIKLNGQLFIIIEAKKYGLQLGADQINQLYRYYGSTDAKIAILTNGDEYWFFTDSKKVNQMDLEPYLKIKVSEMTQTDMVILDKYSKESIQDLDITDEVIVSKFKVTSNDIMNQIISGNLSSSFIDYLIDRAEIDSKIEKAKLASIFVEVAQEKIGLARFNGTRQSVDCGTPSQTERALVRGRKDFSKKEDIELNHEYKFKEVSWVFHAPEYIVVNETTIEAKTLGQALVGILEYIMKSDYNIPMIMDKLGTKPLGLYIVTGEELAGIKNQEAYKQILDRNIYVYTIVSAQNIIPIIDWLDECMDYQLNVRVSFRR